MFNKVFSFNFDFFIYTNITQLQCFCAVASMRIPVESPFVHSGQCITSFSCLFQMQTYAYVRACMQTFFRLSVLMKRTISVELCLKEVLFGTINFSQLMLEHLWSFVNWIALCRQQPGIPYSWVGFRFINCCL